MFVKEDNSHKRINDLTIKEYGKTDINNSPLDLFICRLELEGALWEGHPLQ